MKIKDLAKIANLLEDSKRSENSSDYFEEGSWGPAGGAAAKNARTRNQEIDRLIAEIRLQIARQKGGDR